MVIGVRIFFHLIGLSRGLGAIKQTRASKTGALSAVPIAVGEPIGKDSGIVESDKNNFTSVFLSDVSLLEHRETAAKQNHAA